MKVIGVTGGIGMGKSTAGKLLQQRGFSVSDTDAISHALVGPGQPALHEIAARFGPQVIDGSGRLLRDVLAKIVFSDPAARRDLEQILHPKIRATWQSDLERARSAGEAFFFVLIPLLFETNAAAEFDTTICIACSNATQRQRLRERSWNDEHIEKRIAAQWPIEKKINASDFVVWTDTTLEVHDAQLGRILDRI